MVKILRTIIVLLSLLLAGCSGTEVPNEVGAPGGSPGLERGEAALSIGVASLGDSYASGEGCPADGQDLWPALGPAGEYAEVCHRSPRNGRRLAAQMLAASSSVEVKRFADFSCAGATVRQGLLGPQEPVHGGGLSEVPAQLEQLQALLDQDASFAPYVLLLSVGGNDVGFGNLLLLCVAPDALFPSGGCSEDSHLVHLVRSGAYSPVSVDLDPCAAVADLLRPQQGASVSQLAAELDISDQALRQWLFDVDPNIAACPGEMDLLYYPELVKDDDRVIGLANLPSAFDRLATAIEAVQPPPEHVIITTYPDPTRNDRGAFCDAYDEDLVISLNGKQPSVLGIGASLENMSAADNAWIYHEVLVPLNEEVRAAAHRHGWILADGLAEATSHHGYCASVPWFNDAATSWQRQGDFGGLLHPNDQAQRFTGSVLLSSLLAALGVQP